MSRRRRRRRDEENTIWLIVFGFIAVAIVVVWIQEHWRIIVAGGSALTALVGIGLIGYGYVTQARLSTPKLEQVQFLLGCLLVLIGIGGLAVYGLA